MRDCERCFWLDKHKIWKRPGGIMPSLPSGMDKILKNHFDKFREKELLPPELCDQGHCEGMKLFNQKDLLKAWRNNLKGIRWEDKEGNILCGAVDDLLIKNNKIIVLDFKTRGYALKENTSDMYQNALDIYNFLLRKNNYKTEDFAFLLYYIPKEVTEKGEIIFDKLLIKRKINVENAEKLFNNALKLLNSECPEEGCGWCEGK